MATQTQDDLIILDDTSTTLDSKDTEEKNDTEINFDDLTGKGDNVVLDEKETETSELQENSEIDLSDLTADLKVENDKNESQEEVNLTDTLLVDSTEETNSDESMNLMDDGEQSMSLNSQEDNFDLDEVTQNFIEKLNNRKEQISSMVTDNKSSIKDLEEKIKKIENEVSTFKGKIDDLNEEDKKIDSRISLLTGDIKAGFNKTRKKAT